VVFVYFGHPSFGLEAVAAGVLYAAKTPLCGVLAAGFAKKTVCEA